MTTDAGGNKINEQGHFPYGESWYSGSATTKWVFTNYERDPESGNDYAQARVYVNRSGRFSSPDPFSGASVFPQSLNRYVYATDDPINFIDPSGLVTCWETWQVTWVWNDDPGVWEVKSTVLVDWGCALDPSDLEPSGSSGGAGGGPGDSPPVNLRALFDCIMNLFGINGLSFKPSEPGKFGAFVGEGDANGDFTIYNNDTKYNRGTLTYMAKRVPGNEWIPENGVHGRTSPSNPYENYTARDATSLVDTQIYELGNSLAFITGTVPEKVDMRPGPNNNEPGNLLLKCVKNGGPFPLSSQQ
jgi:RHS repeat-associated protein